MMLNELGILAVAALSGAFGGVVAAIFRSLLSGPMAYVRPVLIGATAGVVAVILALAVTEAHQAYLLPVIGPALIAGLGGSELLASYVRTQDQRVATLRATRSAEAFREILEEEESGNGADGSEGGAG